MRKMEVIVANNTAAVGFAAAITLMNNLGITQITVEKVSNDRVLLIDSRSPETEPDHFMSMYQETQETVDALSPMGEIAWADTTRAVQTSFPDRHAFILESIRPPKTRALPFQISIVNGKGWKISQNYSRKHLKVAREFAEELLDAYRRSHKDEAAFLRAHIYKRFEDKLIEVIPNVEGAAVFEETFAEEEEDPHGSQS